VTSSLVIKGEFVAAKISILTVRYKARSIWPTAGSRSDRTARFRGRGRARDCDSRNCEGSLRGRDRVEVGRTGDIRGEHHHASNCIEEGAQFTAK